MVVHKSVPARGAMTRQTEEDRFNPARHGANSFLIECDARRSEEPAMALVAEKLAESEFRHGEALTVEDNLTVADKELLHLVREILSTTGYAQLRHLQIYCHSGRVTLQGSVPTYYLKQVAQTAVRRLVGIRGLDNDVKVVNSW